MSVRRIFLLAVLFHTSVFSDVRCLDFAQIDLSEILKKEAEYCRKLEGSVLDFICLEEITEKINQSKDIKMDQPSLGGMTDGVWSREKAVIPASKIRRTFLYDYQFIRKDNQIKESRTLLEENGKKKRREGAQLKTANFVYQNALLGPVGIFGERWQPLYDYKITGEGKVGDRLALILDVVPKTPHPEIHFLFGKAYLDKNTLEILKVEWNEQKIGNYVLFETRGQRYGLRPRVSLTSEFNIEKNGIRFPTKLFVEEAYLSKNGKKFVRSETNVVYGNFKFFTVEVEFK